MISVRNPFAVSTMLPQSFVQGELPNSKQTYGRLFKIAAPSVAELVLTSLIGMVDTQMVSGLGDAAIAAVSLVAQPRMLVLCIYVIGMGVYGVWVGMYADMIGRMIFSLARFAKGKWFGIKI